jgi:hypothetical protein
LKYRGELVVFEKSFQAFFTKASVFSKSAPTKDNFYGAEIFA